MTFSSSQLAYVISTWSAAYGALLELWRHSWAEAQRDGPGDRRGWTAWDGPICGPQCPKNHIYPYMVFVYIYILYMDIYIYTQYILTMYGSEMFWGLYILEVLFRKPTSIDRGAS